MSGNARKKIQPIITIKNIYIWTNTLQKCPY